MPMLSSRKMSSTVTMLIVLFTCLLSRPQNIIHGFYAQPEMVHFVISPDDMVTCEGCGQVKLTCGIARQKTSEDIPNPDIQWMWNGSMLSTGALQMEQSINDSLIVSHLFIPTSPELDHSGLYRCVATDGISASFCRPGDLPCVPTLILSSEARVAIIRTPNDTQQFSVTNCSRNLLICWPNNLERHLNELQVSWSRDGQYLLTDLEDLLQLPNGDLVLSNHGNSSEDVNGVYECSAILYDNVGGVYNVTVARYRVETDYGTLLNSERENTHVSVSSPQTVYLEGEVAHLLCQFNTHTSSTGGTGDCLTATNITWYFEGDQINSSIPSKHMVLILNPVRLVDSGTYCCQIHSSNGTYEACTPISILPKVDTSLIIENEPTLFIDSSVTGTVEISTSYPAPSQLVWYHNGVELVEQRRRTTLMLLHTVSSNLFGAYQCFVSVPGLPQVLTKSARVMPHDRTNPPGPPMYQQLVRANSNGFMTAVQIFWQPPLYTANLTSVVYQLYDGTSEISGGRTASHSVMFFFDTYILYSVSVRVFTDLVQVGDSTARITILLDPFCSSPSEALFPPRPSLSCVSGSLGLFIHDNQANSDPFQTSVYYVRGSCVDGNEVAVITQKLTTSSFMFSFLLNPGTHCTLEAAATTNDFSICAGSCSCYDPNLLEYSQPAECTVPSNGGIYVVRFTSERISVSEESNTAQVCVMADALGVHNSNQFDVEVFVHTSNRTAVGGEDFVEEHSEIHLNGTAAAVCVVVTIIDDKVLETSESFFVSLTSTDPAVNITDGTMEVFILDNDNVSVSITVANGSVLEEVLSVAACVELAGLLEREVVVTVSSGNGSALEGIDFYRLQVELRLNGSHMTQCVGVSIIDDQLVEGDEHFLLDLNTRDPAVVIERGSAEITILDDDRFFTNAPDPHSDGVVAGVGVMAALVLLLLIGAVAVYALYKFRAYKKSQTYGEKQMQKFKWKESHGEEQVVKDDIVPVDFDNSQFSINRDDDVESVFEYYHYRGEKLTTTDHELKNHPLYSLQLDREVLETGAEDGLKIDTSSTTVCHNVRQTSGSSGFSEHSHYIQYPLKYNNQLDSNQTEQTDTYILTAL